MANRFLSTRGSANDRRIVLYLDDGVESKAVERFLAERNIPYRAILRPPLRYDLPVLEYERYFVRGAAPIMHFVNRLLGHGHPASSRHLRRAVG